MLNSDGPCVVCGVVTDGVCKGCCLIRYCCEDHQRQDMVQHMADMQCPVIRVHPDGATRRRILTQLNRRTKADVTSAMLDLWGVLFPDRDVELPIIWSSQVPPSTCGKDTACTDGVTVWISPRTLTDAFEEEEGHFTRPKGVSHIAALILHEFGHLVFNHPYRPNVPKADKEMQADCWALSFMKPFK